MPTVDSNNRKLPLAVLVRQCRQETELYQKRESYNPDSCFEIWRRAFQDRDHLAWESVYDIYTGFVRAWLRRQTGRWPMVRFDEEALLNGVFIRAFRFITPEKFTNFTELPRLMEYLKTCCMSEVLDVMRHKEASAQDVPFEQDTDEEGEGESLSYSNRLSSDDAVEESVIGRADRDLLWQLVARLLRNKAEKVLIHSRFVLHIPPREIALLYPQYFPDEKEVYRQLKNITWRLKQDPKLRSWFKEYQG